MQVHTRRLTEQQWLDLIADTGAEFVVGETATTVATAPPDDTTTPDTVSPDTTTPANTSPDNTTAFPAHVQARFYCGPTDEVLLESLLVVRPELASSERVIARLQVDGAEFGRSEPVDVVGTRAMIELEPELTADALATGAGVVQVVRADDPSFVLAETPVDLSPPPGTNCG